MKYSYMALDQDGNTVSGSLDAENTKEVISLIREKGLFPTKVVATEPKSVLFPRKKTNSMNTGMVSKIFKFKLDRPLTTMEKVMMVIISLQLIIIAGLAMR